MNGCHPFDSLRGMYHPKFFGGAAQQPGNQFIVSAVLCSSDISAGAVGTRAGKVTTRTSAARIDTAARIRGPFYKSAFLASGNR